MDINTKKLELIKLIDKIKDKHTINKIDRFIHDLDYGEEEYERKRTFEKKEKDNSRIGAKNKVKAIFKMMK